MYTRCGRQERHGLTARHTTPMRRRTMHQVRCRAQVDGVVAPSEHRAAQRARSPAEHHLLQPRVSLRGLPQQAKRPRHAKQRPPSDHLAPVGERAPQPSKVRKCDSHRPTCHHLSPTMHRRRRHSTHLRHTPPPHQRTIARRLPPSRRPASQRTPCLRRLPQRRQRRHAPLHPPPRHRARHLRCRRRAPLHPRHPACPPRRLLPRPSRHGASQPRIHDRRVTRPDAKRADHVTRRPPAKRVESRCRQCGPESAVLRGVETEASPTAPQPQQRRAPQQEARLQCATPRGPPRAPRGSKTRRKHQCDRATAEGGDPRAAPRPVPPCRMRPRDAALRREALRRPDGRLDTALPVPPRQPPPPAAPVQARARSEERRHALRRRRVKQRLHGAPQPPHVPQPRQVHTEDARPCRDTPATEGGVAAQPRLAARGAAMAEEVAQHPPPRLHTRVPLVQQRQLPTRQRRRLHPLPQPRPQRARSAAAAPFLDEQTHRSQPSLVQCSQATAAIAAAREGRVGRERNGPRRGGVGHQCGTRVCSDGALEGP